MQLITVDVTDRRQVRRFLDLPFRLYRACPQWVPPLAPEARRMLDRRHPFYRHSEAAFFMALERNGQPLGRLAVLENRHYNDYNRERTAFFYLFECANDPAAAGALFDAAFTWARARGLEQIVGPKGFSALDGQGLLVHGFEHRPAFGIPYNFDYYPALVEAAGLVLQNDVLSGYLDAHAPFPERIHQLAEIIQRRRGLRVARFHRRRDLRALIPHLKAMYNSAIQGTPGNVPLTDEEVQAIADQLLWFADPRLIKLVLKDDRPVGFLFAYPDISAAVQRTGGRFFPFGWADMLRELRRTPWVNVNGAGMVEEYRGLGGTAVLFSEMHQSITTGGFTHVDLVQIGANNDRMLRELRDLGVDFYKTHRLYRRALT